MKTRILNQPIQLPFQDLQLFNYGYEICTPYKHWGPGIKEHIKLHIILDGEGTYILNKTHFSLHKGDVFVTTPHNLIEYFPSPTNPWTYGWFAFDGHFANEFLNRIKYTEQSPFFHIDELALLTIYEDLHELIQLELTSKDLFEQSFLYKTLGIFVNQVNKIESKSTLSLSDTYVSKALQYIKMNYDRGIHCNDIACKIGVHPKYLTRLFNQHLGVCVQKFLCTYRMDKAKELLNKNFLSISEIAYSVGYKDPLVFSKAFKREVGASPKEYRTYI